MSIVKTPGRPLKIGRRPSATKEGRLAAQQTALEAHLAGNKLVQLAQAPKSSVELLWVALEAAARDAAAIAFQRTVTPVHHRDFGRLCSRHLDAVRDVARLRLLIAKLEPDALSPGATRRVLESLLRLLLEVAEDTLPGDAAERFSTALGERWEEATAAALGQR